MTASLDFKGHILPLEEVPCAFCGGNDFIPFWRKMRHGFNLPSVFCSRCGLCQSRPRPTEEALERFYSHLYNFFHNREVPIDPNGEYVRRSAREAEHRTKVIKRFLDPTRPARVLEIGAGVGQCQRLLREQTRWTVSGLEPGKPQQEVCQKLGLDVRNAFFDESAGIPSGSFDALLSFHVLEHVPQPARFLALANRGLADGGILHLEVPNLTRPGGTFSDFFQLPHLFAFNATTLRNFARCAGFEVLFIAERYANLVLVARKVGQPLDRLPNPGEYELYDVENYVQRLRMLERVFTLARAFPDLPGIRKVRGTLLGI